MKTWFYFFVLLLFLMQMPSYGDYWSVDNVGARTYAAYIDLGVTQVPITTKIQYIWMGPNGYIDGPNATNNSVAGDDLVMLEQVTGTDGVYGNPLSSGRFFYATDTAGHNTVTSNVNKFYARVWHLNGNAEPVIANCNYLGEIAYLLASATFIDSSNPKPTANDREVLGSINSVLPNTLPAAPTLTDASCPQVSGPTSPTITVRCNKMLAGRYAKFELYSDSGYTSQVGSTQQVWYDSSYHYAATATSGAADISTTFTVTASSEDRIFYFRALAGNYGAYGGANNGYGDSNWANGQITVLHNTDIYIPVAITDLQATLEGRIITLSWTAPYDKNSIGDVSPVASYAIRVSSESIIDQPQEPFSSSSGNYQTNPSNTTNWAGARSITTYSSFSNSYPTIPTPAAWGTKQYLTITNVKDDGTYFFAIKSTDGSGNISYISNCAGVKIGTFGGGSTIGTKTYTFRYVKDSNGRNPFSIPFTIPLIQPVISSLEELIKNINIQAAANGANYVKAFAWWDETTNAPAGFDINYSSSTLNDFTATGTAGLGPLNSILIQRDKIYQLWVSPISSAERENFTVNFTIKGTRTD